MIFEASRFSLSFEMEKKIGVWPCLFGFGRGTPLYREEEFQIFLSPFWKA
jgi:hypothetical protein